MFPMESNQRFYTGMGIQKKKDSKGKRERCPSSTEYTVVHKRLWGAKRTENPWLAIMPVSQSTEPLSWVSLMGTRKVLSLINVSKSVHPKFYVCSNDFYFILFGSKILQFPYGTM